MVLTDDDRLAAELREPIKGIPPELYADLDTTQRTTRKV